MVLTLCGALLIGLGAWWWQYRPAPMVGGGMPPNFVGRAFLNRGYSLISRDDERGYTRLDLDHPNGWLNLFSEPVQSLDAYQHQDPIRPSATRRTIVIQPLGPMNEEQRQTVVLMGEYARAFFQLPVRVASPLALNAASVQTRRTGSATHIGGRQFEAGAILNRVLRPRLPRDAVAYFGVTSVDLYADNLGYVFGLGDFTGRVGVYSLSRYFPEFWNRKRAPGDEQKALRRACQILNHEIGHVLGLSHCVFYHCSMNGCNSLFEADATPIEYCPICHRKLMWNIGFDATQRYTQLQAFEQRNGLTKEAAWLKARLAC